MSRQIIALKFVSLGKIGDNRIKVVHKKNAGLGYARNTGIDCATGEYICFVDSDDYIATDMVEKTYKCAEQYNADIVMYGYNVVDSNGKKGKGMHTKAV